MTEKEWYNYMKAYNGWQKYYGSFYPSSEKDNVTSTATQPEKEKYYDTYKSWIQATGPGPIPRTHAPYVGPCPSPIPGLCSEAWPLPAPPPGLETPPGTGLPPAITMPPEREPARIPSPEPQIIPPPPGPPAPAGAPMPLMMAWAPTMVPVYTPWAWWG